MRTMEPGKWRKTERGYWVAKTDSDMSFKMVARTRAGWIYAAVQEGDGRTVSSKDAYGGFASVKDAKQWCDAQWARHYSFKAKIRRIERAIAALQRDLANARRLEGVGS